MLIALSIAGPSKGFSQPAPLPNAFAHNDYNHKRPLFEALENGYTNIEADIFLLDDELVVAHMFPYLRHGRTLEKLYLKPLMERIKNNGGHIYQGYNGTLTLMIDIKTGAENTYNALLPLLEKYKEILTRYENGCLIRRQVTVVLSGHKPWRRLLAEHSRLAFIDADLIQASTDTVHNQLLFDMASCKYSRIISWKGDGSFPSGERNRLCAYVQQAHKYGRRVRLWASPEKRNVWNELLNCGVDLINTDNLPLLSKYLSNKPLTYAKASL